MTTCGSGCSTLSSPASSWGWAQVPSNSGDCRMSALGQKQTSEHVWAMSALPPKADIGTQPPDVRFVPKADIAVRPKQKPRTMPGLRVLSEVFNSTRSVPLYFANARRPHRSRHPIDYGEARPSTPSRGRTGRIGAGSRLEFVPIVCDPDVAGRINRHVGYHLDASALKNMDDIARLRAGR